MSNDVIDSTITFTFGDAGENHTGNQIIGEKKNVVKDLIKQIWKI